MVCLARDRRTCPWNISCGTFFNLCRKVILASTVLSIMAPIVVDAWRGVCVGIIVIESSGWISIMLAPGSSIFGILINLFLIVAEFK